MCTYKRRESTDVANFLTIGESGWTLCRCSLIYSVNFSVIWSFLKTRSWKKWYRILVTLRRTDWRKDRSRLRHSWIKHAISSEILSASSRAPLCSTVFSPAADRFCPGSRHIATGLSRFPGFRLVTREKRSVHLCFSLKSPGEGLRWPQLGSCTHPWVRK